MNFVRLWMTIQYKSKKAKLLRLILGFQNAREVKTKVRKENYLNFFFQMMRKFGEKVYPYLIFAWVA